MLEKAIKIAVKAHKGQVDKAGMPYILHCFRVMLEGRSIDEMIVGVLHDVVEDTDYTLRDLAKAGFKTEILEALQAITRNKDDTYSGFIQKCSENELARKVKSRDLKDNLNGGRFTIMTKKDKERMKKYGMALRMLDLN